MQENRVCRNSQRGFETLFKRQPKVVFGQLKNIWQTLLLF